MPTPTEDEPRGGSASDDAERERERARRRSVRGRRDVVATSFLVLGTLGLVAWFSRTRGPLAPEACSQVLDRYEELRLQASRDKVTPNLLDDMQARVKSDERTPDALADCQKKLSRSEADCALKAPNADELERCFP